ncbi:MAG: SufB/SufD family protein [bacterium]
MGAAPAADHAPALRSREVSAHPVPTGREEEWRFTPLAPIGDLLSGDATLVGAVDVEAACDPGARIERVGMSDARVGRTFLPSDLASARAMASSAEALIVTLPREWQGTARVSVRARGEDAAGHLVIEPEPFSDGTVVVDFSGAGRYFGAMEIRVGDGARLTVVSLQDWSPSAVHVGEHHASLGRDARLLMSHITLGGSLVRLAPKVSYLAPGGDAELLGLFFADAGQHMEHRVFVDHDTPHCRSSVLYKGALQGEGAHSVWIGDVLVRAQAVGVDTYEVNRNLLLTDGARADSVPNLELETGEIVGAGHASATGRFDDEQLFYLQSRGIPADVARVLVVRGFFADVLQRIGQPDLTRRVMSGVDARLGAEAHLLSDMDEEADR